MAELVTVSGTSARLLGVKGWDPVRDAACLSGVFGRGKED